MISKEKADFIRTLADADGYIEPEDVVAAARDPSAPIHGDFNWDVAEAANAHWLDQARRLIRLVKVEFTVEHHTISAVGYVADPDRPPKSHRYVDLTVAAMNRETAKEILLDEMGRITSAVQRAKLIAKVLGLSAMLEKLLDDVASITEAATVKKPTPKTSSRKRARVRGRGQRSEARV